MEESETIGPRQSARESVGTVFLVVPTGYSARYLLRTDVLPTLLSGGARVVVLTPNADEKYFRQEFEQVGAAVEPLESERCVRYYADSPLRRRLVRIRYETLSRRGDLVTLDDKNREYRDTHREEKPVQAALQAIIVGALKRSRMLRRAFVDVESFLFPGNFHAALFDKYDPDLLVTTSVGYFWPDFLTMREARRRGVRTVSVVLSWDNPSSKGLGGASADHAVVWTDVMRDELVTYLDFDERRVFVGGVAHWDQYHSPEPVPCAAFLRRFGLDPARKTILFGAKSPRPYPNHKVVQILAEATREGRFSFPTQLLVRLHPGYFESGVEADLDDMMRLREAYPHVAFSVPEILSKKLSMDMPSSEMVELHSMLGCSDVLVNLFSTLSIEASILDLPVVNVGFDIPERTPRRERRSILIDERQVHNRRLLETGGVSVARSPDELIRMVDAYLVDPALHAQHRAVIARREGGAHQGQAGRAIGEYLLGLLRA